LVLAACTSTTAGKGHSKFDLPPVGYDATIFLCPSTAPFLDPCTGAPTGEQTAAVRTALVHDPEIGAFRYLSEADQLKVARKVLPAKDLPDLGPGTLPASFMITLADPAKQFDDVRARYAAMPGVQTVTRCSRNRCTVATLRAAGVVH
jgi:cell division protein FtsX